MSRGEAATLVAVALVRNERGEVLLARRGPRQHMAGRLEFPGGKVEAQESVPQALCRELREELGLEVALHEVSDESFIRIRYRYPEKTVLLDVREVRGFAGEPVGQEGQEVLWAPVAGLVAADFPDANEGIILKLQQQQQQQQPQFRQPELQQPQQQQQQQTGNRNATPTPESALQLGDHQGESGRLTHLDHTGAASMVDVTDKDVTTRTAVAEARVRMQPETLALIVEGRHRKGDVFAVCRIAGIQAAKKTADLIPLCQTLNLTSVKVDLQPAQQEPVVVITTTCRLDARTGVEMEALTAASIAALTLYDMCKAVDRGMVIESVRLLEKAGGRSGHWTLEAAASCESSAGTTSAPSTGTVMPLPSGMTSALPIASPCEASG